MGVQKALEVLREAETNLVIFIGESTRFEAHKCRQCGAQYTNQEDLAAHMMRRHSGVLAEGIDVEQKKFGPQANAHELLNQVRSSLRILEIGARATGQLDETPRFEELVDGVTDMM